LTLGDGGPKDEKRATDLLQRLVESASTPDELKRIAESRSGTAKARDIPGSDVMDDSLPSG
jgi:hypothetical protein